MNSLKKDARPVESSVLEELDEFTLARAQRGDAEACRTLITRYQRPVFALLSRMLVSAGLQSLVEDLAQETFLRVFRALPGFSSGGNARLSTWILTIATRLAIDELRKHQTTVLPDVPAPSTSRGDTSLEQKRLGEALAQAVGSLSEEFRATFLLREYHGLTYEEMSRALDCDIGTVKSRLSRARRTLRQHLSRLGYHI